MKIKCLALVIWLKKQYNTKATEIENKLNNHDKYITTQECNTLAAYVFNARLAQANLVPKTDFYNTVSSLILIIKLLKIKKKNGSIENELKRLKTFD